MTLDIKPTIDTYRFDFIMTFTNHSYILITHYELATMILRIIYIQINIGPLRIKKNIVLAHLNIEFAERVTFSALKTSMVN